MTTSTTDGTALAALLQSVLRMETGDAGGPPTPAVALAVAIRTFLDEDRVDMQVLAAEVGVGRATLYRWFGDREQLIGLVLSDLSRQALQWLADQAPPDEKAHILHTIDAFMRVTSEFPPLRRFLAAEPALGLRALLEPEAPLITFLSAWATERLAEAGFGEAPGPGAEELAEVLVQVTSTYCWARIIAGGEADVDGAMRAVRVLLRTD